MSVWCLCCIFFFFICLLKLNHVCLLFLFSLCVCVGSHVTYTIQSDEMLLSGLSVVRGDVPQNITVTSEIVKHLGPGCHQLTLYASNTVTLPPQFTHVQVFIISPLGYSTPGLPHFILTSKCRRCSSLCSLIWSYVRLWTISVPKKHFAKLYCLRFPPD